MRCPNCGSVMEILKPDCYIEEFSQEEVLAYFYGYCDECKKTFTWNRYYVFSEDCDPEEID